MRVALAMSGGVDSSVAAALLKEQGHEVTGVFLRLPVYGAGTPAERACCGSRGAEDAQHVASGLGIPFYVWDLRGEFERTVIADFCAEYSHGRTPNPCARCNQWIKFGAMLDRARTLGFERLATGHYATLRAAPSGEGLAVGRGADGDDQSYFLYALAQEQLRAALFPVGGMTKPEVRALARSHGLPVHEKPASQDLCFLADGHYLDLLRERCPEAFRPGPIVHVSGRVLGTHEGLPAYTIGQRRGLGVAHSEPLYVVDLRPEENVVVVGERRHASRRELVIGAVNWTAAPPPDHPVLALVKIRYNHAGAEAEVAPLGADGALVRFAEPQQAPCPGQAAVFYRDGVVLGGGIIERRPEEA